MFIVQDVEVPGWGWTAKSGWWWRRVAFTRIRACPLPPPQADQASTHQQKKRGVHAIRAQTQPAPRTCPRLPLSPTSSLPPSIFHLVSFPSRARTGSAAHTQTQYRARGRVARRRDVPFVAWLCAPLSARHVCAASDSRLLEYDLFSFSYPQAQAATGAQRAKFAARVDDWMVNKNTKRHARRWAVECVMRSALR